ncbi:MAG: nucleoside hydrolase [Ardenticatenales bacterium]|nr:nucleoside hydrolase [Ardenticatenales bacterium]
MERFIIDTDPGVDDAQAILLAAAHPNVKVEALLAVGGNVGLEHTLRNAVTIAEQAGLDIPVYGGSNRPLIYLSDDAAAFHGADGLGDAGFVPQHSQPAPGHAAVKLVEMVNAAPGEYTLVCLGPLTNIAIAIYLDPELPNKVKRTVAMAGAVTAHGNTPIFTAEFNIYYDPEAAYVVFESWARAGKQIEVIDWEATMRHSVNEAQLDRWMALTSAKADFFQKISVRSIEFLEKIFGEKSLLAPDPLAMAVAVDPSCVKRQESHYLVVETTGKVTRGQTAVDWADRSGQPKNAVVVLDVDLDRFYELFEQGLQ